MTDTVLPDVAQLLDVMTGALRDLLAPEEMEGLGMIGIHTGGAWVARHLHHALGIGIPLGILDINFYRDDFSRIGVHPQVRPSHLPFNVEGSTIVLVDDVLHSGRTIRAALNEIFDYGRPARVILAILVERSGRELPIQPDICATSLALMPDEQIKLSGPDPLVLMLKGGDV